MKKYFAFLLLCVTTFSLFGFSTVYAGNRAGALTVTLGGGYEYFASKRQIQNAGVPFGILGYNFTNKWAFEALYGAFTTDFDNSVNDDHQINGNLFLLDAVYRFGTFGPCCMVEPFVLAGVGITGMDRTTTDSHNEGNINAGLGVQLFPHKDVAFRMEARDLYTRVGGKNDVMLDAGVSFLFDV